MRSLRSFARSFIRMPIVASLMLSVALTYPVQGQQQKGEAKRRVVPRLTTDEVIRSKPSEVDETGSEGSEAKSGEEAKPPAAKLETTDKTDPQMASWRERVEKARERAKVAQREAEEGELRVTQLRNQLGSSGGTARDRNETAAGLEEAGVRLRELRAEARRAEADLKELLEIGRQKSFTETPAPKATSESGEPNHEYFKTKYAELNESLQAADRQIQLYGNRIRELSERMNNPGVDGFTASQLQQDRDEAQQKLREAQESRTKAQNDVDELLTEARRAGVPPGLFR